MEEEQIENARWHDIVNGKDWPVIRGFFENKIDLLEQVGHMGKEVLDGNWDKIGKEVATRLGTATSLQSIIEEIENRAAQHSEFQESLKPNPNQVIQRAHKP